jgi:hypothetical protein
MAQQKMYTENTKKDIKLGNLICSIGIILGIWMLFYPNQASLGVIFIVIGVVGGIYYRLKKWWEHG